MHGVASKLNTLFCSSNTPKVAGRHACKFCQDAKELASMFFVFIVYDNFVAPIIVKAVVVSLLDSFVSSDVLETVEDFLVEEDGDGIDCISH